MNPYESDKKARHDITSIEEIDSSFFVEASAGSGKTTSLVARMVNMVKAGRDVDKICAITFTKAAANEFYSRFREALAKEKDDMRCKEALENIDLVFMGTIDAFCQRILSEHPVEAGIPSSFVHIDADELSSELRKAIVNIKTESSHPLHESYTALRKLYRYTNLDSLILNGALMYWERRNASLAIPSLSDEAYDGVIRDIRALSDELGRIPKSSRDEDGVGSKAAWNAVYRLFRIRNWDNVDTGRLLDVLDGLTKSETDYGKLRINGAPGQTFNSFYFKPMSKGKRWQPVCNPFKTYREQLQNSTHKDLLEFIGPFVRMESEDLKKRGRLTYFDAKIILRDMLKRDIENNSSRLIRHIQKIHRYYLVDEFQDTDPMQAEILFYLTAEKIDADWRKCIPQKGSLFIVGDPKQSIYRFRGADIASFCDVKNLFLNGAGKVEMLTCNFRSSDRLCTEFNEIFADLLARHQDNSGSYESGIPVNSDAEDEKDMKVFNNSTMDGIYRYNPGECRNDPEEVGKIVSRIVHNPSFRIQDYLSYRKDGAREETREVEYRDIMVITPDKKELLLYMDEFKRRDIPYVVEGAVMFGASFALRLAYYFMSYFSNPCDRGALYGIKTIGGIDIEDEEIKKLNKRKSGLSPSALLSAVISLPVFEKNADTENYEYLYYALELLRSREVNGKIVSLQDALSFLESLILGESDNERCLQLERDSNAVRLANLHKVKGLEAPIVILAYPKKPWRKTTKADIRDSAEKCYIFNIRGDNNVSSSTVFWDSSERAAENDSMEAEKMRGLYVAATRARNMLLVSSSGEEEERWKKLADKIERKFDPESIGRPLSVKDGCRDCKRFEKLIFTDDVKNGSYSVMKPSDGHEAVRLIEKDSVLDSSPDNSDSSLKGTMVHRLMEIIVLRKGDFVSDEMIHHIVREYSEKEDEPKYRTMLKKVRDRLFSGGFEQKNGAPEDFVSEIRNAGEAHAEVPFSRKDGKTIINGFIDCIYRNSDGWHIIDYKTNRSDKGLGEIYAGQLEVYRRACETISCEVIRDALIYHIDIT